ncbi:MAG: DUF86 domain-containing protein [Muribaculaceae bacterium]|nr:DUF86 domain-containing protein [Muribaculaceae bacterium]
MREAIRDRERLIHIGNAIQKMLDGIGPNIENIQEGSLEYFGIVKLIEIIGEAVYKLTPEFKSLHPLTPWRQIERMRHVLVHGYYTVSYGFIKEVVLTDIPILQSQIKQYLSEKDFI